MSLKSLVFLSATLLNTVLSTPLTWNDFLSYDNVWVDPDWVLSRKWNANSTEAQQSILVWADELSSQGPWSVTYKSMVAVSGDKHDWMSFAPYFWPNCTGVGNTTELTPAQISTTCPYRQRDGEFVPDFRSINDTGSMAGLCDSVLYNGLAWAISGQEKYGKAAVSHINTWFLDPETRMNPNLNYAQVVRGPGEWVGRHLGVLDLKNLSKLVSGLLVLRKGKFAGWTTDMDTKMNTWATEYLHWLDTNKNGIDEGLFPNNHGTFWYNQYAALRVLIGDMEGARRILERYFSTQYKAQIADDGEQPLEAHRTRKYHYRAYNLGAMITNAKIADYVGLEPSAWNRTSIGTATIKTALDFAMQFDPADTDEVESAPAPELYDHVASVARVYGDADGKYAAYLARVHPNYPAAPYFFFDNFRTLPQGYVLTPFDPSKAGSNSTGTGGTGGKDDKGNVASLSRGGISAAAAILALVMVLAL